jgi:hypothetical protein
LSLWRPPRRRQVSQLHLLRRRRLHPLQVAPGPGRRSSFRLELRASKGRHPFSTTASGTVRWRRTIHGRHRPRAAVRTLSSM